MGDKKHILIIDDSTITLKQAREMLKDDFRLAMCKSSKQGLDFIKDSDEKPDLILLDINMPQMDGYETMARIMADKNTCTIPVIFLTSDLDIESEVKGLRMGAMDFIHKPFVPEIVRSRINRILEVADLRKRLEGQVENKTKELEELSEYTSEIQEIARTDGLTGIFNRAYFENVATDYIGRMKSGYMFMLDLDNFKGVNDMYGHIAGDEVLKKFADIIVMNVDGKGIIGRIGGDEFVVILGECNSREEAAAVAKRIISDIKDYKFRFTDMSLVSSSIGISVYPDDGKTFMELYNTADKALYYVKQNGKMGYHFYSDQYQRNDGKEAAIQADLEAIKQIIGEYSEENGAYLVEYEGFKKIYHFLERVVERTNEEYQILLFTVMGHDGNAPATDILGESMGKMHDIISTYLRKGDVATTFSSCQYIVLLIGAGHDQAVHVAERIVGVYREQMAAKSLTVKYDCSEIENISGNNRMWENESEKK